MNKRRGTSSGGKRIADKLKAAVQQMPGPVRVTLKREFSQVLAELLELRESLEVPAGWSAQDDRDLKSGLLGLTAIQQMLNLLGSMPDAADLVWAVEASHEHFMPGGPPMSPVHDSMWVAWASVDLRVGRYHESLAEVARVVLPLFGIGPRVIESIDVAMASRFGIYRVLEALEPIVGGGDRYRLRELVTEREIVLQLLEDYDRFSSQNLLLLRPIDADEAQRSERQITHLSLGNPYVLMGTTEPEWLDYFERETAKLSKSRLTPASYEAIMRGAGDTGRWLEYVTDGYAGSERHNVVHVEGIPDRPETLPEHEDYDEATTHVIPPRATPKQRSTALSRRVVGLFAQLIRSSTEAFLDSIERLRAQVTDRGGDFQDWIPLTMAVFLYRDTAGGPALVSRAEQVAEIDEDLREWIAAARASRVSVYEVTRVVEGERMTVRDLFDGSEIDIEEREATLGLPTRSILFGMLVHYRGVWIIEGLYPRPATPAARDELIASLRPLLSKGGDSLDLARLEQIVETWDTTDAAFSKQQTREFPQGLATTTGEALSPTHLVFEFGDNTRDQLLAAIARLQRCEHLESQVIQPGGERVDEFVVVTRHVAVEAHLRVTERTLEVQALAVERADKVVTRIRTKLAAPLVKLAQQAIQPGPPSVRRPPDATERAVIEEFFRDQYAVFLDEPIPMLDGKTPREAAKLDAMRSRLDQLLREHEHSVAKQIGAGVIDFAAMRRALGLAQ